MHKFYRHSVVLFLITALTLSGLYKGDILAQSWSTEEQGIMSYYEDNNFIYSELDESEDEEASYEESDDDHSAADFLMEDDAEDLEDDAYFGELSSDSYALDNIEDGATTDNQDNDVKSDEGSNLIKLVIDGEIVSLGREPRIVNNRLLVPVRVILEYLGAIVHWDAELEQVTISTAEHIIRFYIGSTIALIEEREVSLDAAATIFEGATFVPLRFLAEANDGIVHWDVELNTVFLSTPQPEPEPIIAPKEPDVELIEPAIPDSKPSSAPSSSVSPLRPSAQSSSPSSLTSLPGTNSSAALISIGSIRKLDTGVELVITGKSAFTFTTMQLSNPERYVIDLKNTILEQAGGTLAVNTAGIIAVRYAFHDSATEPYTRIVLDMEGSSQGLDIVSSNNDRILTIKSSYFYVKETKNQRLGSGEELTFSFDGSILPQIEAKYLNTKEMKPIDWPEASVSSEPLYAGAHSSVNFSGNETSTSSQQPSSILNNTTTNSYNQSNGNTGKLIDIVITTDDLNMRSGPGIEFDPPLRVLPLNTEGLLIDQQGEWVQLLLADGSTGWCHEEYLIFDQRYEVVFEDETSVITEVNQPEATTVSSSSSASNAPISSDASSSSSISTSTLSASSVSSIPRSDIPANMQDLGVTGFGFGTEFRVYLPGVFAQLPHDFKLGDESLMKKLTLTPTYEGAWLNVELQAAMPYQLSMIDNQLELALNLDTVVKLVEVSKDSSGSKVTINMSRTVGYDVSFTKNPDRVVITIPGASIEDIPQQQMIRDGLVRSILCQQTGDSVRLMVDLEYMVGYRVSSDKRSDSIQLRVFTHGLQGKTIFLDPGHGGNPRLSGDPGSVTKTLPIFYESTGTLDIALRLRTLLEDAGVIVLMSRTSDIGVGLQARVDMANRSQADVLLSIHHNSSTNTAANGIESYYWEQTVDRERLANVLQKNLINDLKLANRGVKREEFYPIKYVTMPSALVELGFLSNALEETLIRDEMWRQRVAQSLFDGLKEFFNPQ